VGNDALNIVSKYTDYFQTSSFIEDVFRWLGWKICIGLKVFCDFTQTLFDAAYQLVTFTNDTLFKDFLGTFYPLVTAIFVVSILALGLVYMFSEKRPTVVKNILIGMAVLFVAPQMTDLMNDLLLTGKTAVNGNVSVATQAVSSNIKDLKYIATNNFNFDLNVSENTAGNLAFINASEHVKPSSFSVDLQKEVFEYVPQISDTGEMEYVDVGEKGMFDIFDPPYYYRYSYHFLQIVVVLLANILILLFSSYSVIRMIWEIIITRIIGYITSLEITSGQKLKKCVDAFFNSYYILFLIVINIKLFQIAQQYINNKFPNWEQGLIRSFLIIFVALVVIDGPKFIEQLFGNDLGISHGSQKMMGLMRIYQQHQMQSNMRDNHKSQQKSLNENNSNSRMNSKTTASSEGNENKNNNDPNLGNENNNNNSEPNVLNSENNTKGAANNFSNNARSNTSSVDNKTNAGGGVEGSNLNNESKSDNSSFSNSLNQGSENKNPELSGQEGENRNLDSSVKETENRNLDSSNQEGSNRNSNSNVKQPGNTTPGSSNQESSNRNSNSIEQQPGNKNLSSQEKGARTLGSSSQEPENRKPSTLHKQWSSKSTKSKNKED